MASDLTMSEYVQACVGFDLPENTLKAIFDVRGVSDTDLAAEVSLGKKELSCADAYRWALSKPSGSSSFSDADGGWKHSESSSSISSEDKIMWRKMANSIYKKYGEAGITNKIKIRSL